MRVLVLGVASAIAGKVAARLAMQGHQVMGIDARPCTTVAAGVELHQVDIRKRAAEDLFRTRRPEAVIHMATVTSLTVQGEERHRINLGGTRAVFQHCQAYGVRQVIFVGRHTFYGAAPDVPMYHTEDEPPQQALDTFPELGDLVAADLYAATELWRLPEIITAVLRVCYTLGPSRHGTLAAYVSSGQRVPLVLGYDPLLQLMHEDDMVTAIALALEKRIRGIFNVAGPRPLPISTIIRGVGRTPLPLPQAVLWLMLKRGALRGLSPGALAHIKYPILVDSKAFRTATGFQYACDELETLRQFRAL